MNRLAKDLGISLAMGLVVPAITLNFAAGLLRLRDSPREKSAPATAAAEGRIALPVRLRTADDRVQTMDMDDYLVGVVLAEMPADFEMEALKAQSVVARTYARKAWETTGKHGDGSVCREPSCCQGYRETEAYLAAGGSRENVEKIRAAVLATSGQVLTYGNELIEATYFSCSGGRTEDAQAVWGREFPYLQSVNSPGEEEAAYYRDQVTYTLSETARRLNLPEPESVDHWFGAVKETEGGGVETMVIGGKTFSGTDLRRLLSLRSTSFTVEARDNSVTFVTRGYGHRVGMSQYGADAMAATGHSYEQILAHYYQGAELARLEPEGEDDSGD